MRYTDMTDIQRIYEDTVYTLVNHTPYLSLSPFDKPPVWAWVPLKLYLIFAFDNTYYYYLGTDKYEIPKYL